MSLKAIFLKKPQRENNFRFKRENSMKINMRDLNLKQKEKERKAVEIAD